MKKYLLGSCAFNEGEKIRRVIQKYNNYQCYDVLIIDDGSTDGSLSHLPQGIDVTIIRNQTRRGAGHCIRQIFDYAEKKKYTAVFFTSGNDKDDPADIEKLQNSIEEGYDFIQGSRYLKGGAYGSMPVYRKITTRFVHPVLFSLITGQTITDSTNGFRAVRLTLLKDPRINIKQDWLNHYELEPYMFYKAITLGYKVKEVPVKKIYPPKKEGYTKMKPLTGWWSILRPLVLLGLGIKK